MFSMAALFITLPLEGLMLEEGAFDVYEINPFSGDGNRTWLNTLLGEGSSLGVCGALIMVLRTICVTWEPRVKTNFQ